MLLLRFRGAAKIVAAVVFFALFLPGVTRGGGGQPLRAGTEVFAVAPDLVLEVSYRTPDVNLSAQRRSPGEPFALIFWEKKQPQPASCLAGEGFARILRQLTSLKLRRTLEAGEVQEYFQRNPLSSWAELEIRDVSAAEPFRARLHPGERSAPEALVHFHGVTYLVDFQPQVFNLIAGGCLTLGVERSPKVR